MVRIFSALAAITLTAAPLLAIGMPAPAPHLHTAKIVIGMDEPVYLGSMTVSATPLPER